MMSPGPSSDVYVTNSSARNNVGIWSPLSSLWPSEIVFLVITASSASLYPRTQSCFRVLMATAHPDDHCRHGPSVSYSCRSHTPFFLFGQREHTYCCLGNSSGPHTEPTDPCQAWRERAHQRESLGRSLPAYMTCVMGYVCDLDWWDRGVWHGHIYSFWGDRLKDQ